MFWICYDECIKVLEEEFDWLSFCFIDLYFDVIEIKVFLDSLEKFCD